jgi:hypothetical protein
VIALVAVLLSHGPQARLELWFHDLDEMLRELEDDLRWG